MIQTLFNSLFNIQCSNGVQNLKIFFDHLESQNILALLVPLNLIRILERNFLSVHTLRKSVSESDRSYSIIS